MRTSIHQFKNQDIVDYLKQFGIVPNKTFTLELPYINWNVLRGVFDGDGSISFKCVLFNNIRCFVV